MAELEMTILSDEAKEQLQAQADRIRELEAERERLREALREVLGFYVEPRFENEFTVKRARMLLGDAKASE